MKDARVRSNDWDEYTLWSESKNDYMACQHLQTPKAMTQDKQEPIFTHTVHPASSGSIYIILP